MAIRNSNTHNTDITENKNKLNKNNTIFFLLFYYIKPFCETKLFNDVHTCAVAYKLHPETLHVD